MTPTECTPEYQVKRYLPLDHLDLHLVRQELEALLGDSQRQVGLSQIIERDLQNLVHWVQDMELRHLREDQ